MRTIGLYGLGDCGKSETQNALKELLREKGRSISEKPHPWSKKQRTEADVDSSSCDRLNYIQHMNKVRICCKIYVVVVLYIFMISCSNEDNTITESKKEISAIRFPNPPIEIETNEGAGMQYINYFNIIKLAEDKYFMYYSAFENGTSLMNDWDQNIYFAYSTDGFHYIHKSLTGGNNVIIRNVVEPMALYIPGAEKPFRLIANVKRPELDINRELCMWESSDGFSFDGKKVLLDDATHDTQNVMLVYDNYLKLYARSWLLGEWNGYYIGVNRKLSVCTFDFNGNQISEFQMLPIDYVYTSAATIYEGNEIVFPTYFNDRGEGGNDSCHLMNYIVDGLECKELPCDLNKWILDDEKWVMVSPGILKINGKNYLGYTTKSESHDYLRDKIVTKYKLIEIVFE